MLRCDKEWLRHWCLTELVGVCVFIRVVDSDYSEFGMQQEWTKASHKDISLGFIRPIPNEYYTHHMYLYSISVRVECIA